MGDEWDEIKAALHKDLQDAHGELGDELERQARETMRVMRESAGELGSRVMQAMQYASVLWNESSLANPPAKLDMQLSTEDEQRARSLVRRWVRKDFLVDPDLAEGMHPLSLRDAAVWRIEVREQQETRSWGEGTGRYTGGQLPPPGPTKLLWEYDFAQPEIDAGERRERLDNTAALGACLTCQGTGHRTCSDCEGKGFVQCSACHGRARVSCRRCRGRGRIADPKAERKARSSKSYIQVHAERLATDAAGRLADFSERLRQDYGVPLPPSARWAPLAPASGETLPCPDCQDGTIACTACRDGKQVCATCRGSTYTTCADCDGTGRVIRYREVVRRFESQATTTVASNQSGSEWVTDEMLRRASGVEAWSGDTSDLSEAPPINVPAAVWMAAREVALDDDQHPTVQDTSTSQEERQVTSRRVRLSRVPATWLEYAYSGHQFEVVAVGEGRSERFWSDEFPPRWSHVGRFFKALARDLNGEHTQRPPRANGSNGTLHVLDEYRTGKSDLPHVRILEDAEEPVKAAEDQVTSAEEPAKAADNSEASTEANPASAQPSTEPEGKE